MFVVKLVKSNFHPSGTYGAYLRGRLIFTDNSFSNITKTLTDAGLRWAHVQEQTHNAVKFEILQSDRYYHSKQTDLYTRH